MDDLSPYGPVLLVDAKAHDSIEMPRGIAVLTSDRVPGLSDHFADLGIVAALLRPDRYCLATATTARDTANMLARARQLGLAD